MEVVEIVFDYMDSGCRRLETISLPKEEFDKDILLMLVCSYIHSCFGYHGVTIDEYLHNRFPNVRIFENMACNGGSCNIIDCHVEDMKTFGKIAYGLLNMTYYQAEDYMIKACWAFNESKKNTPNPVFSVWEK